MNVTRQNMQNLRLLFCRISLARSLVYLFCTSLFLYQLIKLLPSYFAPTLTHTEVAQMQLKDIDDFPLNIKVCVRPGLNKTALKQLGYVDKVMFIMGRSQLNGSLIGIHSKSEKVCGFYFSISKKSAEKCVNRNGDKSAYINQKT